MHYAEAMAKAERSTSKYRNYAELYDLVVATLPRRPTVVEIGVANGGSLETWRALLGDEARIAGVDLNPRAVDMRDEGFEIFILDTGQPTSWQELRHAFPAGVDLIVDDGGHTNRQQIAAIVEGIPLVRDGGWLVIEDMHASFMHDFGNPSPYSTARFINDVVSDLHRVHPRSSVVPRHPRLAASIAYVVTGTSWVGIRVRRATGGEHDEVTHGANTELMDYDHRWDAASRVRAAAGIVPGSVRRLLRNQSVRVLSSVETRPLYRSDARDPSSSKE